jgi:Domain of unknown function (DUF4145)
MLWGTCPRCHHKSTFEHRGYFAVSYDHDDLQYAGGTFEPLVLDRVSELVCRGCHQGIAVVEEHLMEGRPIRDLAKEDRKYDPSKPPPTSWRGFHWWPTPGAADLADVIPAELRDAYSEGMRSLGVNAPRSAVVMFRRTVEGIVRDKGGAKAVEQLDNRDLAGALRIMAKERELDPALADWAQEVRLIARTGAHFDPMEDVTPEQAGDLGRLIREMFRSLYETPAVYERLRESRGTEGTQPDLTDE